VSKYLKPKVPRLKVILADPQGSGLFNKVKYNVLYSTTEAEGTRRRNQVDSIVEGIGINRLTKNFESGLSYVDNAIRVTDQEAVDMARYLLKEEGIFVGSSSAVHVVAAVKTAKKYGPGHRIVTLLCDSGTRHLTKFWYAPHSQSPISPFLFFDKKIIQFTYINE
jgi:cysteine synthase A